MDLVRSLRTLRRRWRMLVVLTVLGSVAGFALASTTRPDPNSLLDGSGTYLASHTLLTTTPAGQPAQGLSLQQVALLTTRGDVAERVAQRTGGDPATLADSVIAVPDTGLNTIEVNVVDAEPERAALLADTFAYELQAAVRDLRMANVEERRTRLTDRLDRLSADLAAIPPGANDPTSVARREAISADIVATQEQITQLDREAGGDQMFTSLRSAEPAPTTPAQIDRLRRAAQAQMSGQRQRATTTLPPDDIDASEEAAGVPPLAGAAGGGFAGLFAGIALVLVVARLDPRIQAKEDAEEALGMPVIAEVPSLDRNQRRETTILTRDEPYSRHAEGFRVLRSAVLFARRTAEAATAVEPTEAAGAPEQPGRPAADSAGATQDEGPAEATSRQGVVIMITSPGPGEGKTTATANLAVALAESGESVLVVNCDFRRPRIHLFFGVDDQPRRVISTAVPGVKLISGAVNPREPMTPAQVVAVQRQVVLNGRRHFDYVLLDTAPVLTTSDAAGLLSISDMIVTVVRAGRTTRESADRAAEMLERFDAPVIGAVLVGATETPSARYYYYYYHSSDRPAGDEPTPDNPFEVLASGPTRPEADPEADSETETETRVDTETRVEAIAETDAESEAEVETEVGAEAEVEAETETETEVETDASDEVPEPAPVTAADGEKQADGNGNGSANRARPAAGVGSQRRGGSTRQGGGRRRSGRSGSGSEAGSAGSGDPPTG